MIIEIRSPENRYVKRVRHLHSRKYREKYNSYLIEGVRIVEDAIKSDVAFEFLMICDELFKTSGGTELYHALEKKDLNVYHIPDNLFGTIADTETPQGILAVVRKQGCGETQIDALGEDSVVLIFDRIQDPGNMGTLIRTADAAGIDAVIVSKGSVDPYNLKCVRATMGSIFHIPVVQLGDTTDIVDDLKERGYHVVSACLETDDYFYQVNFNQKIAIVIGNEGSGIAPEVLSKSDHLVKIPILGKAESLNASVAGSIMIYEAVRQRLGS